MSVAHLILKVVSAESLPVTSRIASIATTAELLAAGHSERQIETFVRNGALIRIGRGVYANGARAREILKFKDGQQLLGLAAALAVVGPSSLASHQSAAYLHSIDLLGKPGAAVLTCPPERGRRGRTGIRLHAATVPAEQVTTVVGLRVTTPARTVVDLARTLE